MACILVAEDDQDIAVLIRMALASDGHEVDIVGDGAQAVVRFDSQHVDLVCLDLAMPVLDGIGATAAIRTKAPEVPVLLLTASASSADLSRAEGAGITAYMPKPFRPAELREQVRTLLETTRSAGRESRRSTS